MWFTNKISKFDFQGVSMDTFSTLLMTILKYIFASDEKIRLLTDNLKRDISCKNHKKTIYFKTEKRFWQKVMVSLVILGSYVRLRGRKYPARPEY